MITNDNILQQVYDYIGRFVDYPSEQAHIAHAIWIVGTYFLEHEEIRVFDNYPILYFTSTEPESGKSQALGVTRALSYLPTLEGVYTAASLLHEIDEVSPKIPTVIVDELDEMLYEKNEYSSHLTKFLNAGYQRGVYVVRRHLKRQENVRTHAYCPKALAGLSTVKLKKATRTRTIIITMLQSDKELEFHIDKVRAKEIVTEIQNLRSTTASLLRDIDERTLSALKNRSRQIWHPLLAVAKVLGGDEWFKQATDACEFFTSQKAAEDLGKTFLVELFKIYAKGTYQRGIQWEEFVEELERSGLSTDKYRVISNLKQKGYNIPTSQIKRNDKNLNGVLWEDCQPTFAKLSEPERTLIHNSMIK
jgi:hypothetical protein